MREEWKRVLEVCYEAMCAWCLVLTGRNSTSDLRPVSEISSETWSFDSQPPRTTEAQRASEIEMPSTVHSGCHSDA